MGKNDREPGVDTPPSNVISIEAQLLRRRQAQELLQGAEFNNRKKALACMECILKNIEFPPSFPLKMFVSATELMDQLGIHLYFHEVDAYFQEFLSTSVELAIEKMSGVSMIIQSELGKESQMDRDTLRIYVGRALCIRYAVKDMEEQEAKNQNAQS